MKNFTITYKNGEIMGQNTLTSVKQLTQLEGFKIDKVVNNLTNEVIYDNTNLLDALIKCDLVEDVESIEIDSNIITTDLGEYIVFYDYTDAENEAVAQCKQIIEVCGLSDNLIFEAEIQGLIDTQWFIDYWQELHEFMSWDDPIDYIASEEELEKLENGELSEEEIRDNYFNSLQDSIKGQEIEEYKFQFGEKDFNDTLIREGLIDIEALAHWCVDMDGVAHFLASYDGEEIEENGYYIYRTN